MNSKNTLFYNAMKSALRMASPLMLALVFLGIGYGIYMRSCGFGAAWPVCMAAAVFAGSMEFITVGLLQGAFNPFYTLLLTVIVNGRHLFYGISMLEKYRNTGWKKIGLVSGLIDEAFSLNYTAETPAGIDRSWFMFLVTLFLYLSWLTGTAIGAVSGSTIVSEIKGVGFVMTSLFIVIFINQWQKEKTHGGSLLGLLIAGICLPLFGKTYFMLPTILIISFVFTIRWFTTKEKTRLL